MSHQEVVLNRNEGAVIRLVILLGLFVWMFWPKVSGIMASIPKSSETVQVSVIPLAILLLIFHRRTALAENLTRGSVWGIGLLVFGLALYAANTWPFNYGYICDMAMIPVLAGIVLVTCGWRVLKLALPMLLLTMLAIPIGSSIYARLAIRPETYTIAATAAVLDRLPGVDIVIKGVDLFFCSKQNSGVIALGESFRGVRLLQCFAALGVFVLFSRIRSAWRVLLVAAVSVPIVLFCNFLRFFCWGLLTIYTGAAPGSELPRNCSAICSLLMAYALFAFVSSVRLNLLVEDNDNEDTDTGEDSYVQR